MQEDHDTPDAESAFRAPVAGGSRTAALAVLARRFWRAFRPRTAGATATAGTDIVGYVLQYRDGDLGRVYRADDGRAVAPPMLHVQGGISGALEYLVPSDAIVAVYSDQHRAEIDSHLSFEADPPAPDGTVLLVGGIRKLDEADPADWERRRFDP